MTTYRGMPCCPCQAEWIPAFEVAAQRRGLINGPLHIYQLIGDAPQSMHVHRDGGENDFAPRNLDPHDALIELAREMGCALYLRTTGQGFSINHLHGPQVGCPHLSPEARAQYAEIQRGEDGLIDHRADYGPGKAIRRTWQQGIEWARTQMETTMTNPVTFVDSALNFKANTWTLADCDAFIAAVKSAGHSGFFYYISRRPSKCMPRWAILRCVAGGLIGAGIFEDTEDNPKGGASQGHADAAFTLEYLKNLGAPSGSTVLNAFDRNSYNPVPGSPEREYAEAFAGDIKEHYTPGGYGDRAVVDLACHEIKMLVQTWTKTGTANVHIVQMVNDVIRKVTNPECDTNLIVHGFPCWRAVPTAPAPKPIPALPQTAVHVHNMLRDAAMVPATESAARISHIRAAQAHLKESLA